MTDPLVSTTSSPAATPRPVPVHPDAGRPSAARLVVLDVGSRVMLRVLPRIPNLIKRLLLGWRTVTVDGNTLDTTLQLMLTLQGLAGGSGLVASNDLAAARAQLNKLSSGLSTAISVGVRDLSVPGADGPLRARHYSPLDATGNEPLLVFYHGGGFVVGDLESHDAPCRLICRDARVHVLSVEYRLAPEHPAPAGVSDAYAVFRWAVDHAAEFGADPARVAVGGDSAGGNLAAVVCQVARNEGGPMPVFQLLLYPVTDFHGPDTRSKTLFADGYFLTKPDMDWFEANYLNGAEIDASDPRVSPLIADDLSGLPPALVATAGFDPLRDEGDRYAERLAAAGVVVDHRRFGTLVHGFANFFPLGGGSTTAMAELVSAFRAHLSRV